MRSATVRLAVWMSLFVLLGSLSAQVPYGNGTAGSGNYTPTLSCNQAYMGNGKFAFQIQNALGGATGLFALSTRSSQFMVGSTEILVDITWPQLLLLLPIYFSGPASQPGVGSAVIPLPLAFLPTPALAGMEFYAQCVVVDYATPGSPAASRGLKVELTYPPMGFVGTSVGGSADPYYFVDPISLVLTHQGGSTMSDNVTDAVFTHGGTGLFVGSSIRSQVNYADVTSFPPTWRTVYTSKGSGCYGMGYDRANQRLYTLTDPGNGQRELVALDVKDPNHPNFGQMIGHTVMMAGGTNMVERWTLSPSGKLAAVLVGILGPTSVVIVDTDPTSVNYLKNIRSTQVPTGAGLVLANRVVFSADENQVLVLLQNSGSTGGEVARFDRVSGQWLDHNSAQTGIQNIGANSNPPALLGSAPTSMKMAPDGRFAALSGFGGTGWVGRLDLWPGQISRFAYQPLTPSAPLQGAWACGLTADASILGVGTFPSSQAVFVDPMTGNLLGTVGTPSASNVYTFTFR